MTIAQWETIDSDWVSRVSLRFDLSALVTVPDEADKPVNTLLGCVAGDGGKDVILWMNYESVEHMPRWWRNEGLSRESFELAKLQCGQVPEIRRQVAVITLNPGQFIFMPKNTYHWVCPSLGASWTVMVTSSFY